MSKPPLAKKRGLGRGLEALLGPKGAAAAAAPAGADEQALQPGDTLRTLVVTQLQPGKYQPRREMDEVKLAELAESIKARTAEAIAWDKATGGHGDDKKAAAPAGSPLIVVPGPVVAVLFNQLLVQ